MEILGGPLYTVAGAGESHGPAVTTIVMGCPAGQYLRREKVQAYLDRRRPGGNKHGTPRNEKDKVVFLSGLYQDDHDKLLGGSKLSVDVDGSVFETEGYEEGYTTGEPIAAIVLSTSKKSGDYTQFAGPDGRSSTGAYRPGQIPQVGRIRRCPRRRPIELSVDHQRRDRRFDCADLHGREIRHGDPVVNLAGRAAEGKTESVGTLRGLDPR